MALKDKLTMLDASIGFVTSQVNALVERLTQSSKDVKYYAEEAAKYKQLYLDALSQPPVEDEAKIQEAQAIAAAAKQEVADCEELAASLSSEFETLTAALASLNSDPSTPVPAGEEVEEAEEDSEEEEVEDSEEVEA